MDLSAIKPRSLVEQVCDQLSEFIRTERSSGKDRLPAERRLAEQFGVGRGVVREAIKRLENQGLVNVRQGSGLHIEDKLHRPLTGSLEMLIPNEDERLRQLNEARIAMEPQAARLAARRATPELLTALRTIHAELVAAPDIQSAIETDMAFHRAVAEASGNLMFRLILDSLAEIGL
ncbi:MAG: FadR/GntR family transcriptional regulator, partial [Limisphaerales bacterium]